MTVAEYMDLRCLCGARRSEHAIAYADLLLSGDPDSGDAVVNPAPTQIRVIGVTTQCDAFTWELERELTGDPLANKPLRPPPIVGN